MLTSSVVYLVAAAELGCPVSSDTHDLAIGLISDVQFFCFWKEPLYGSLIWTFSTAAFTADIAM